MAKKPAESTPKKWDMVKEAWNELGQDVKGSEVQEWVKEKYSVDVSAPTVGNVKTELFGKKRGVNKTVTNNKGTTITQLSELAKAITDKKTTVTKVGEQLDEILHFGLLVGGLNNLGAALDALKAFSGLK